MLSHSEALVKDLVSALSALVQLTAGPDITAVTGTSAEADAPSGSGSVRSGAAVNVYACIHTVRLGAGSPRGPVRVRSMPGAPENKSTAPGGSRRGPRVA